MAREQEAARVAAERAAVEAAARQQAEAEAAKKKAVEDARLRAEVGWGVMLFWLFFFH